MIVEAKYIAVLDNTCRDHCIHLPYLTYLQQFHFTAACIALRIIAPFVTRYSYSVHPIFAPTNPIPFTSVCFLSIFPYSLFPPILIAKRTIELDARNCFERGWRQRKFDRISYQTIYREKYASDLCVSHFSAA